MMAVYSAAPVDGKVYELGEGILWDDRERRLRWVDISQGKVHSGAFAGSAISDIQTLELHETIGAVALSEDGGLILAAARGLATVSPSGVVQFGPDLLSGRPAARLNDGAMDPFGSFIVGSVATAEETGEEVLLRVSPSGAVETLREGVRLSNGIAFSPDGTTIYHVDSFAQTVSQHSYGIGPFDRSEPWVSVLDASVFTGLPDGMTIDAAGTLWVAEWGESRVGRFSPTGELIDTVKVSGTQVSSVTFAGPDLTTLALTTARIGLRNAATDDGAIFLLPTASPGLLPHRWLGSTSRPYWHAQQGAGAERDRHGLGG